MPIPQAASCPLQPRLTPCVPTSPQGPRAPPGDPSRPGYPAWRTPGCPMKLVESLSNEKKANFRLTLFCLFCLVSSRPRPAGPSGISIKTENPRSTGQATGPPRPAAAPRRPAAPTEAPSCADLRRAVQQSTAGRAHVTGALNPGRGETEAGRQRSGDEGSPHDSTMCGTQD